jgi:hypothetical protein
MPNFRQVRCVDVRGGAKAAVSTLAAERQFDSTWHLDCSLTRWTEGVTAMQLPFTKEQFFDLFAAYNVGLWPALIALWSASVVFSTLLLSSQRPPNRWISALLAAHWAWSALAYQAAFFTRINPAAWLFAALFLVQAALFLWLGVVRGRLSFAPWRNRWAVVAWLLVAYSLAYPMINAVDHRTVWRIPTFGVPCPTTIFTAGLLMLATPRSWRLSTVPVIWSLIGGSAAPLLSVRADYALPMAGMALAIYSVEWSTPAGTDQRSDRASRTSRVAPRLDGPNESAASSWRSVPVGTWGRFDSDRRSRDVRPVLSRQKSN